MILVIAAMSSEVDDLLKDLTLKTTHPFMSYEGKYSGKDILLVISGIGKTNASSALSHMLTTYPHIKQIINVGIVGGHRVALYETFVVSEVTYHDVDLTVFNYEYGQIPKFPTIYFTETSTLNKLNAYKQIRLYTGDIFSTKPINSNPYIVDMEGASIYQVAHSFKYPVVSIKIVSDVLGTAHQMNDYQMNETELSGKLLDALVAAIEVL